MLTPGLTAGRVSGEKDTPEAMLRGQHHLRRWPGDGRSELRIPTSVRRGLGGLAWLRCRAGGAAGRLCQAGTKSPNPHSPPVLAICAICAIWLSQGKPLNIHSPPGPCYIAHIARSPETVGVQRLGVHAAPCRSSKSGCPRCPQWEVESPTVDNSSSLFRGGFPNGFYST